jgi:hypothetical protein
MNSDLQVKIERAVAHYWQTRTAQRKKQEHTGKADQGLRSAVTGGAHMDGFIDFFSSLVTDAGLPHQCIFRKTAVELPGFFRPTKEWDLLVVRDQKLVAAIEAKSQVGPSFGNNFNNRTEEAMGSALDLWTAFRERAYLESPNHLSVISSCWKTVRHPTALSESRSLTSRYSPSSLVHRTCVGMNSSAENSF